MRENISNKIKRPVILIHGLWNNSGIFKQFFKTLDRYKVEYYAPTLFQQFGMVSIADLAASLDKEIINNFGLEREIDIVGFSMGGIVGRYWIKKFEGFKRTKKFISIGKYYIDTISYKINIEYILSNYHELV